MGDQRYWVYENGYLRGPFEVKDLAARKEFSVSMMICPDGDHLWRPVHAIPEIAPVLSDLAHAEVLASGDYLPESTQRKTSPAGSPTAETTDSIS
jgi:hypothetical protein